MLKYDVSKRVYEEIRIKKTENLNLYNINSDYVGWINIKDTPIDYPILKGEDNDFYLTRDFYKEYLFAGSIFMDYRNKDFQDRNVVIYGHHMRDESMFGSLKRFKDINYTKENNKIYITDKNNEELIYEIFSVYIAGADDIEVVTVEFNTEEEFYNYISEIKDRSFYDLNLEVNNNDKILTLFTCSYEFKTARLIIHAKLIT